MTLRLLSLPFLEQKSLNCSTLKDYTSWISVRSNYKFCMLRKLFNILWVVKMTLILIVAYLYLLFLAQQTHLLTKKSIQSAWRCEKPNSHLLLSSFSIIETVSTRYPPRQKYKSDKDQITFLKLVIVVYFEFFYENLKCIKLHKKSG